MAGFLLQLRDALTLSYTKFRTRRIRTILTLISTSVLSLILVVCSSVLTGVMAIAGETPQSQLTDLHLASVPQYSSGFDSSTGNATPTTAPNPEQQLKTFRDNTKSVDGLKDVYIQATGSSFGFQGASLDLLQPDGQKASTDELQNYFAANAAARSSALLQPFVETSQNLNWKAGDPLPLLVSTEEVVSAHSQELDKIKDVEQRLHKRQEFEAALIGKVGKLSVIDGNAESVPLGISSSADDSPDSSESTNTTTDLSVKIVGFVPTGNAIFSDGDNAPSFSVPYEAASQDATAKKLFDQVDTIYPSFDTKQHRNAYANKNSDAAIYADVVESNKRYFSTFKHFYNIAVIVMLVLMAIPMAATLSKILADSQRETGVFRAIGARNRNILAIYGLYSVQLVISAFVLSLLIGFAICGWLSSHYSHDIELAVTNVTDSLVSVSLVRINVMQLLTIFLGLLAGSAVGAFIPMWRSLRRDPIKALRDE